DRNVTGVQTCALPIFPIYVAFDSADTWAHPELFQLDGDRRPTGVAGVPPDGFSATGQLWGNPLYDWQAHRAVGYRWWIDRMAARSEERRVGTGGGMGW